MSIEFFSGANSGSGFYSLYEGFARDKGDFLYLIKGGPGCGKSGFMKKIAGAAEDRGLAVLRILCSGDPDSLDGVYIPAMKTGICDATAPHAGEPGIFGYDSYYVNLGEFCRRAGSELIPQYTRDYKLMYRSAYSYLAAAADIEKVPIHGLLGEKELNTVRIRARSAIIRRHSSGGSGKVRRYFISCIGRGGRSVLEGTVSELCKQIYLLDDALGLAKFYISEAAEAAVRRGEDIILCPSPMLPDTCEALIIPGSGLGFISSTLKINSPCCRHIHLDSIVPAERLAAHKPELRKRQSIISELTDTAVLYLKKAGEYHDLLEAEYKQYMDFAALDAYTDEFIKKLFG